MRKLNFFYFFERIRIRPKQWISGSRGLNLSMLLDENAYWWIKEKHRHDWWIQKGDNWYVYRNGTPLRSKAPKSNPAIQTVRDKKDSSKDIYFHISWILAALLGISLALNICLLLVK